MTRFDFQHPSQPPTNDPLAPALEDVAIPEGLETRILASVLGDASKIGTSKVDTSENASVPVVVEPDVHNKSQRWSRRSWLAAGLAAGIGGVLATRRYLWTHRKLPQDEVVEAVNRSLAEDNWLIRRWALLGPGFVEGIPIPAGLRPSGWQYRNTSLSRRTVAYKLTRPGGPTAVLFACKTNRNITAFPAAPPPVPQCMQSGKWTHIAIWRATPDVLYVLAVYEGLPNDYDRLFPAGAAVPFA